MRGLCCTLAMNRLNTAESAIFIRGQGLEYWGSQGGPNSQQAHDVVMTSMRRNDVASTSFQRHVSTRF